MPQNSTYFSPQIILPWKVHPFALAFAFPMDYSAEKIFHHLGPFAEVILDESIQCVPI